MMGSQGRVTSVAGSECYASTSRQPFHGSQIPTNDNDDNLDLPQDEPGIQSDDSDMDMEVEADYSDDPNERITNPTLYLKKLWRQVLPQGPIFLCYRDPVRGLYSATLTLVFPPNNRSRIFRVNASYSDKRAAKRAVSELAISKQVEADAMRSISAMDRIGTEDEPRFKPQPLPKRDERFNQVVDLSHQEDSNARLAQNPVTALNLAVQRYCVESPTQALVFEQTSTPHNIANYRIHGCKLVVRITPDLHETYTLHPQFTSAKIAKEAVTRLALQEGVIALLKLHNSYTSRVCRQMGLPVPLNVQDHNPIHEDNTAGMLGQLVQELTRSPTAMQCEYISKEREGAEYHGAILTIDLRDGDRKTYRLDPCTKSKKEAKETVCRLAVRSGIKEELLVQKRLVEATKTALDRLNAPGGSAGPSGPPKAGSVSPDEADYLENAVAYLNLSLQAFTGRSDALSFDFNELGPRTLLGRGTGTRFGCTLTVFLPHGQTRQYPVDPEFPSKKFAKESAAKFAIKSGVVELAKQLKAGGPSAVQGSASQTRARNAGYPTFNTAMEASINFERGQEGAYSTPVNRRAQAIPTLDTPNDDSEVSAPPPYMDTQRTHTRSPDTPDAMGTSEGPRQDSTADRSQFLPQSVITTLADSSSEGRSSGKTSTWTSPWHSNNSTRLHPDQLDPVTERRRQLNEVAVQAKRLDAEATKPGSVGAGSTEAHSMSNSIPANPLIARQDYLPRSDTASSSTQMSAERPEPTHASRLVPASPMLSQIRAQRMNQSLVSQVDLSKPQSMAEQVHVRTLQDRLIAKFGLQGRSYAQYLTAQNQESRLWSASLRLTIPGEEPLLAEVEHRYPNERMAQEGVAQRAIYNHGAIAIIDAHGRKKVQASEGTASGNQAATSAKSAPAAAQDPFSQPVSYLNQVCQVLLSTDLSDLPKYEHTKKESGSLYGAILTIKTQPVSIYKTEIIYAGKAAAKEAVTRMALEAGIIQKLKDTMILRRTALLPAAPAPASVQAAPATAVSPAAAVPPAVDRESLFSERLDEYCRATNRPLPQWTITTQGTAATSSEALEVSVKIANETFQIDGSKKSEGAGREKLAKMVLKHIRKRDEMANAQQQTTTVVAHDILSFLGISGIWVKL